MRLGKIFEKLNLWNPGDTLYSKLEECNKDLEDFLRVQLII